MKKLKICLIYVDSGGGHRAAANALIEVIRQQGRPWDVEMVCVQDVLKPIDWVRKYSGIDFQDVYNLMLRKGWTLGSEQLIPVMHWLIAASHARQVVEMRRLWETSRPDLVVSLIPHFNRALREALRLVSPATPYVTLLTDIADYPPHFWIETMDQWVICGSERAALQARELHIPSHRILRASGMILHPRFYEAATVDREREREALGLNPRTPTGLVLFGGEGSMELVTIAEELNRARTDVQLILVCGKHEKAASALRAMDKQIPMHIEGFTREISRYMELADFFIGKPGPGSLSEALCKHLPVIVQCNAWTMAHERYNAEWVREMGAGIVVKSFRKGIAGAVRTLLATGNYERMRSHAAAYSNHAVYEIPDMLSHVMAEAGIVASAAHLTTADS